MNNSSESSSSDDPYDLSRFVRAQQGDFEGALSEITSGKKRTHWMVHLPANRRAGIQFDLENSIRSRASRRPKRISITQSWDQD